MVSLISVVAVPNDFEVPNIPQLIAGSDIERQFSLSAVIIDFFYCVR